jgi:hypothetical protein
MSERKLEYSPKVVEICPALESEKCTFQELFEYLEHVIQYNKISKSPEKIRAIIHMPRPSDLKALGRFLRMVIFILFYFVYGAEWIKVHYYCGCLLPYCTSPG